MKNILIARSLVLFVSLIMYQVAIQLIQHPLRVHSSQSTCGIVVVDHFNARLRLDDHL